MKSESPSPAKVRQKTRNGEVSAVRPVRRTQQRSSVTREALLAAARTLFGQLGYHATGTTELVTLTKVTRGALYYQFQNKELLFEAVCRQVAAELADHATSFAAPLSGDTWSQLMTASTAYLQLVGSDPEVQRILLIDGPAVLGWTRWREIQAEIVLKGLIITLDMLVKSGDIPAYPIEALAQLIFAAQNDAALSIAHADNRQKAQEDLITAFGALLTGLRT